MKKLLLYIAIFFFALGALGIIGMIGVVNECYAGEKSDEVVLDPRARVSAVCLNGHEFVGAFNRYEHGENQLVLL